MKKRFTCVEDQIKCANSEWEKTKENVSKGIVDKDQIATAMGMLNGAHFRTIKENKRHLIK